VQSSTGFGENAELAAGVRRRGRDEAKKKDRMGVVVATELVGKVPRAAVLDGVSLRQVNVSRSLDPGGWQQARLSDCDQRAADGGLGVDEVQVKILGELRAWRGYETCSRSGAEQPSNQPELSTGHPEQTQQGEEMGKVGHEGTDRG